jgi:hypothetical protein
VRDDGDIAHLVHGHELPAAEARGGKASPRQSRGLFTAYATEHCALIHNV